MQEASSNATQIQQKEDSQLHTLSPEMIESDLSLPDLSRVPNLVNVR